MDIFKETTDSRTKLKGSGTEICSSASFSLQCKYLCSFMCDVICNLPARCRSKEELKTRMSHALEFHHWMRVDLTSGGKSTSAALKGMRRVLCEMVHNGPEVMRRVWNCHSGSAKLLRSREASEQSMKERRWDGREGHRRHVSPVGGYYLHGFNIFVCLYSRFISVVYWRVLIIQQKICLKM